MSDFFAQYKRPEWQKKRLEVMEASKFMCEDCHKHFHESKQELLSLIGTRTLSIDRLLGYARAVAGFCYPDWDDPLPLENIDQAEGAADFLPQLHGEFDAAKDLLEVAKETGGEVTPETLSYMWNLHGPFGSGKAVYLERWNLADRGFHCRDINFILDMENFYHLENGAVLTLPSGKQVNLAGMESGLDAQGYDLVQAKGVS